MNLDESVDAGSESAAVHAGSNSVPAESITSYFSDSDLFALLVLLSVSLLCVLVAWLFGWRASRPKTKEIIVTSAPSSSGRGFHHRDVDAGSGVSKRLTHRTSDSPSSR